MKTRAAAASVRGMDARSDRGTTVSAPGGRFEIAYRDQRAVVAEVGGGLRAYSAGGRDVLDGYGLDEICSAGRGQVLVPWPNRLQDGCYEFAGKWHQLPLTEPEQQNAIHGLVREAAWAVREREPGRVVMEHLLGPQPGYPFTLALNIEYALSERGLHVSTTAMNVGVDSCPFGSGAHPYLTVGTSIVDDAILCVPGRTWLQSDVRGIPVGVDSVEGTDYDFRRPRRIGATRLDHCFTDLERDADGLAHVELRRSDDGAAVTLWVDATYPYVMLFTGDPLPEVARRSLAVEPMSCPPNAFRSGTGVIVLEPGGSWVGEWGIDPRRRGTE